MKVFKKYEDFEQYICEFTKVCDEYLLYKNEYISTYLFDVENEIKEGFDEIILGEKIGTRPYIYIPFRSPGATRGCLCLDKDHIIRDIKFYEETCFTTIQTYSREVVEATKKFIGEKLEL